MIGSHPKRRIYLAEFNVLMNGTTYLPLVSGLLRAHAERNEVVREHFEFAPFTFHIDRLDRLVDSYRQPAVAAFSMLMWNAKLSLQVAESVKRRWPDCLVVFGGANVPHQPEDFLARHPFIDVTVRGEGEDAFRDILTRLAQVDDNGNDAAASVSLHRLDLDELPGVSWRTQAGEFRHCTAERPFVRDLDEYPSPYLEGIYDELLTTRLDLEFQTIVETNRGCPFKCTFCYWGKGGLSRKYRFHSLERVQAEIDWMASHRIRYVFNADSNFGMHRRDREIAQMLVDSKVKSGYPEKFRTCYGKNTDEKIFEIGKLFHQHELEKGITISYQSVDDQVQLNIKRDNIKMDCARELQRKFNDNGVPVYTELILGLPGESYDTWVSGVDRILASGLENQLFMYICQVFPNTDLAAPEYLRQFGMRTRAIQLTEIHGRLRTDDWVTEEEEIVIGSDAMPHDDWRRALVFSWMTMAMHSLKLGSFVLAWLVDRHDLRHSDLLCHLADGGFDRQAHPLLAAELAEFETKIDHLLEGQGRGCVLPGYGDLYWDQEEACFLRLSRDFDGYCRELESVTADFLHARRVDFDADELREVVAYQRLRLPRADGPEMRRQHFERNVVEYFEALFSTEPISLEVAPGEIEAEQRDFGGNREAFARASILWARKSGTMLATVRRAPTSTLQP